MPLSPGTLLQGGKYRIVRFIKAGGFGCTYEAEHTELKGRVAIKEFFVYDICNREASTGHVSVGTDSQVDTFDKLREKFIREAQSVFALSHPGIVHVSDVFRENGTAYFVMDYIDGCSLDDLINKYGPMDERTALDFIRQACDALEYVHSKGRLHLDIKPGNIMVDDSGHAILIDFGASKQYDAGTGENLSTLLGFTPGFAPPEQITANVSRFQPATDVYALAATLYNLLTGNPPLSSTERSAGEENEPLPATISTSTRQAIDAALLLNKNARTQSVAAFAAQLFGASAPAPAPTPQPVAPQSRPTERLESRPTERKPAPVSPSFSSGETIATGGKSATKSRTPLYVTIVAIVAILTFGVIYLLPKGGETVVPVEDDFDNASLVDSVEVCDSIPVSNEIKAAEPEVITAQQRPAPSMAETKVITAQQQPAPAQAETEAPKGHAACNHLDLYTTYQGKARFFTVDEWNAVPESERSAYTKKGVVVKCNGVAAFSLALYDSGEKMTWDEAVRRYGESALPSKAQCEAMQSNNKAINEAIIAFGGVKGPFMWYWGKSKDSSIAWYVGIYDNSAVAYFSKANTLRVRAVEPVAESAK